MPPSDPPGLLWRDLPAVNATGSRDAPLLVHLRSAALAAIQRHILCQPDLEQIGLLLGHPDSGTALVIEVALPLQAESSPVHVLMHPQAWQSVWKPVSPPVSADEHAIVGWYHSHPGHGVFLSATDLATHALWFGASGGVALVLDPVSGDLGCFSLQGRIPMQTL